METKHTEGRWHVVDGGFHWNNPAIKNYRIHAVSGDKGFDIAWSEIGELVAEHVYEKDDAILMSASKELLEGCITALGMIGYGKEYDLIRAAISKALGETE